jgi:hypothetical protein
MHSALKLCATKDLFAITWLNVDVLLLQIQSSPFSPLTPLVPGSPFCPSVPLVPLVPSFPLLPGSPF